MGGSPEQARSVIEKQMVIWAKVVKDNDIKADYCLSSPSGGS
jgi:hypothetical protein